MKYATKNALICLAVMLSGCVMPGDIDNTVLNRYQETLARRGPQKRLGEQGLDSLRPAPGVTGPRLQVHKDPSTGWLHVDLTLEEAIVRTLADSLDIRVAGFDPAIAREDLIKAAAAFDAVAFGGAEVVKNDGQTFNANFLNPRKTYQYRAGVKQKVLTGATWQVAWNLTRSLNRTTFPVRDIQSYDHQIIGQVVQPLLRDAGIQFNYSQIKLADLNEQNSRAAFRQRVEETVNQAINTYINLIQVRVDLQIQRDLLDSTVLTLQRVKARSELDATAVQIKQVEAAVESRRATLIRAGKSILDVQDNLVRLLNDAQLNLLTDYEIIPVSPPIITQVEINLTDKIITALAHNPRLDQARIAIQAAIVQVSVAKNQTLPRLDLTASTTLGGFATHEHTAWDTLGTGDFVGYSLGLAAEYPIGNRSAMAEWAKQKFNRLKAITVMQNTADDVTQAVNDRVRQVRTNYQEMLAQRASVDAAKIQLQALDDTEKIRGRLTPEFLQVKLQAQETVANSQRLELLAIVQYNQALTDLDRVTGTILDTQRVKIALPGAIDQKDWPPAEVITPRPATKPGTVRPSESVLDAYRRAIEPIREGQDQPVK
jgi:outer membrane protein TolC